MYIQHVINDVAETIKWQRDTSVDQNGAGPFQALTVDPSALPSTVPTGSVIDFAGSVAPADWLLCDGSAYDTTTYADLFAVIGYTYGGAGASFNVPDCRGRASIGVGTGTGLSARTLGQKVGEETHILTVAELAAHNHSLTMNAHSHSLSMDAHAHSYTPVGALTGAASPSGSAPSIKADAGNFTPGNTATGAASSATTNNATVTGTALSVTSTGTVGSNGSNVAHNNMQPSIVFNKIIKI